MNTYRSPGSFSKKEKYKDNSTCEQINVILIQNKNWEVMNTIYLMSKIDYTKPDNGLWVAIFVWAIVTMDESF